MATSRPAGRFVALLRGINVGGNNIIPMADLRSCVGELGAEDVATYIQSGNVLFHGADRDAAAWTTSLEAALSTRFGYEASVVVRSHADLRAVVAGAPDGFGRDPDRFREDVLFLKEPLTTNEAMGVVRTRDGVDTVAAGPGVLYFSRLTARATQSHLGKIVGTPVYKRLTIRNWRTTTRLLAMLDASEDASA